VEIKSTSGGKKKKTIRWPLGLQVGKKKNLTLWLPSLQVEGKENDLVVATSPEMTKWPLGF
jgi:hypothetical protein